MAATLRTSIISRVLFILVAFAVIVTVNVTVKVPPCCAQSKPDSLRISEYPIYDSLLPGDIVKFGVQSGFVFLRDFDTGMDFGGRVGQRFFHPFLQLTSQVHFWAATRNNIDMGVLGIEESITYQIPLHRKLLLTGGFAICYLSILEEIKNNEEAGQTEVDTWGNDVVTYIIFGIEYDLGKKRTFFLESKYGSSDISNEFHIITGMNFYIKELVRQR